jgi:hypothetical protein
LEQNKILEILLARMDADKAKVKREREGDKAESMALLTPDVARMCSYYIRRVLD